MEWIKENKIFVIAGIAALLFFLYSSFDKEDELTEGNAGAVELVTELETEEKVEVEEKEIIMMADIKGAVTHPGVYEVKEGGRVIDLIEMAGGLENEADAAAINFAMYVQDEMSIYVPRIGEEAPSSLPVQNAGEGTKGKLDLNSAQSADLQTLPGIGPAKAEAIIEYRETSGPFKTIEDLKEISGIGEKTFEKLKDLISVK
ncbi:helix-hairpin-helix domain-containing protein [Bacillus sp. ISL-35]|uniref:helix-hairpin-helix domain-containing protein n=1 Tax=Bacillus sp. ISL-35 TaxID=2819122 RepID=UPI001BEAF3B0|nr:helix-hairpin-helix domain-containing protein [Bacillus sp. ISL-35]MBT2677424.1 helix-hairpin-helix domain-containing protein [Bacillus sp. ISL-35]MBT2702188.1 helix-hairpin-helix domain-containing protein [Chryseobacterium sp. ISL-80]